MTTSESPAEIEIQALALNPIDAKFLEQLEETVKAHLSDSEFDVGALAKEMALAVSSTTGVWQRSKSVFILEHISIPSISGIMTSLS